MDDTQRRAAEDVLRRNPRPQTREEARARLLQTGVWNADGSLRAPFGGRDPRPNRG